VLSAALVLSALALVVSTAIMLTTHARVLGLVALLAVIVAVLAVIWLSRYWFKSTEEDGVAPIMGGLGGGSPT
jgi:uncharacterized membrane-anchored protein